MQVSIRDRSMKVKQTSPSGAGEHQGQVYESKADQSLTVCVSIRDRSMKVKQTSSHGAGEHQGQVYESKADQSLRCG